MRVADGVYFYFPAQINGMTLSMSDCLRSCRVSICSSSVPAETDGDDRLSREFAFMHLHTSAWWYAADERCILARKTAYDMVNKRQ